MKRLLRSNSFKIALAFAAALIVTTFGVFGFVYWQFYADNVTVLRAALQDEVRKTADTPIDRLRPRFELRLTQDLRHLDYVGLYDASGVLTFGNAPHALPVPVDGIAHLVRRPLPPPESWESEDAIFVASKRADGGILMLGRSLLYVDQLEDSMLHGYAIAIIPVVLLAMALGLIVSVRASRRLVEIQDAINRVMRGDLGVRLPVRGTPDDIDELVRAVNRMLDEIDRLLHQIKSVGDNIAHDLRAPLAVMRARLERGLADRSEAVLRELTESALGDLERAMTTVTALLRISELESGLRRSAFGPIDLVTVCRDAYDLYEPLGEAKGLTMALRTPAPVIVTGDGDLLREAVANLIDNAIKFTPAGGRVTVTCGGVALVHVADSGPGVPSGERDKIVKRFYRADATKHCPGTGLGLSMAATIVELHGLALRIEDNAPGAIFKIVAGPLSPSAGSLARPARDARSALGLAASG